MQFSTLVILAKIKLKYLWDILFYRYSYFDFVFCDRRIKKLRVLMDIIN